jgi:hypothetical protein
MIRVVHAQGRDVNLHVYRNADKTSCTVSIKMVHYKCILNGMLIFVELPSITFFEDTFSISQVVTCVQLGTTIVIGAVQQCECA